MLVLVTSGRHDEMTDTLVKPLVAGIRGAGWVVFENSAHFERPRLHREGGISATGPDIVINVYAGIHEM